MTALPFTSLPSPPSTLTSCPTDFRAVLTPGPLHLLGMLSPDFQVCSNVLTSLHLNLQLFFYLQHSPLLPLLTLLFSTALVTR